jgi:hypothetical protein
MRILEMNSKIAKKRSSKKKNPMDSTGLTKHAY